MRILAGDIGATKTVLGLFERGPVRPKLLHSMTYSSQGYDSLESIISEFMLTADGSIDTACFGVPGPVLRGECRTTNLKWVVSVENLKSHLNTLKVVLVNDLVATAIAAPKLFEHEYVILNTGECDPTGALGIVAPGTGLGMALMIWMGESYQPVASEGGHVDFAPTDELQMSLLDHMMKKLGRVSVERIAAGPGLLEIFNWLCLQSDNLDESLAHEINSADNPSESISRQALETNNFLCNQTLDVYVSILGSICGNLALTAMTTGGIYLGGGVSPKILPKLVQGPFLEAFNNKGRFRELMGSIPVKIITNDKAALIGASIWAAQII